MILGPTEQTMDTTAPNEVEPPAPLPLITEQQFLAVQFEKPITDIVSVEGLPLARAFEAAAASAKATGDHEALAAFGLLSAVCSIHWRPEDRATAWGPMYVFNAMRSLIPSDLSPEQLNVLAQIAGRTTHPALRARLADIVWSVDKRRFEMANLAIDTYCECVDGLLQGTLRSEYHVGNGPALETSRLMQRALQIANATHKRGQLPVRVKETFLRVYEQARVSTSYVVYARLSEMALHYELLDITQIARDAEAVAGTGTGEHPLAVKIVWDLACGIYVRLRNEEGKHRCQLGSLDQILHMRKQVSGAGAEASWVMDALQAIQHIKGVDELEEQLERDLRRLQRQSMKQMTAVPIEIQIGTERDELVENFSKRSLAQALKGMAFLVVSPKVSELREQARETIKMSPLMAMMGAVHVDDEGKFIAKTGGATVSGEPDEDWYRRTIDRAEQLRRLHVVAAAIEPLRYELNTRFSLEERHFGPIVACSPFAPDEQKPVFALGFARFFQGDLVSAAHLLLPQLEPALRHLLKVFGTTPVKSFGNGTEEDWDIGNMLDRKRPELEQIFSADIVAEIERLYHLRPGPALRHEMAHGKLSPRDCFGPAVIFGVWFLYRLCCLFAMPNWETIIEPALNEMAPILQAATTPTEDR